MSGIPVIPAAPADGSDNDFSLPIGFEEPSAAAPAPKRIEVDGLKHRFYFLLEAGCAKFVGWLGPRVLGAQSVDHGSHVGFRQRVAFRLNLKLLRLLCLSLQVQKRVVDRQVGLLARHKLLLECRYMQLKRHGVGVRFGQQRLALLGEVESGLGESGTGFGYADGVLDTGYPAHADRFLLVAAEGNEGPGERCERSSVPPSYQLETTPPSLRAPAATVAAREPASSRWTSIRASWLRLCDSWLGDLLATLCFSGTFAALAIYFMAP